jgi:lysozyme
MIIDVEKMLTYDEGKKLICYRCTRGFKTVGIGCNLDADPHLNILRRRLNVGDKITQAESVALFAYDLGNVVNAIQQKMYYYGDLPERYQVVLINMVFQMGIYGVLKFPSMLRAMKAGDDKRVIAEMKDSEWYHQTTNRANRMISIVQGKIPKEYL